MTTRERLHAVMTFSRPDRLPIVEWASYWDKTVARWRGEGLSPELTSAEAIRESVGLDRWLQHWARPRAATCPVAPSHGAGILSTAAEYDAIGPHLYPDYAATRAALLPWADQHAAGETVVWLTVEGFFWYPRTLFGIERHLYAFYDEPELMHRMNRDLLEWNLALLDEVCSITTPDFATIAEDMSYNHGPMLSRELFDEFLAPYYRELIAAMTARGITPFVDSDGDVTALIPWLRDVGVRGILPLERMAGLDVARIRDDHPDFLMVGAYDKTVMHAGPAAMRAEFERLLPTMRRGGFIPSVDHQTPPDVSWELYLEYVDLLREYAERAVSE
ncbi:MAG: hypothetical protein EA382_15300 [Spirochaetaceae bacterium]|nr:MAG: hypothetical protein EA382_15300 [Spirochaetaceae bacterium]